MVRIGDVQTFSDVKPDKAQALKPLEEAAEVFGAWQGLADSMSNLEQVVDECCDNIMATCNLLESLGVTDISDAMERCVERNRARGRY